MAMTMATDAPAHTACPQEAPRRTNLLFPCVLCAATVEHVPPYGYPDVCDSCANFPPVGQLSSPKHRPVHSLAARRVLAPCRIALAPPSPARLQLAPATMTNSSDDDGRSPEPWANWTHSPEQSPRSPEPIFGMRPDRFYAGFEE